ncbi:MULTISPECIES: cupredoxin domain-containing protein [unclassified Arthrobacter]|uniref:cupredoxin domain-containing protein n=1 Tax=unclassified Arthrobacter TaxID=235627 RepID=UPI002E063CA3|nr:MULTISPECIES: cupredoxin domain-containing protein [unclassified Arthrobacter]MEC5193526.1 plastocyanin [Arthrobacter sp. MP_M4]MEC5205007.1 plastocyanin [Arthrobacter sp. MP_M7]
MKKISRVLAVAAAVSLAGISGCAAQGGGQADPQPAASSSVSAPSAAASAQSGETVITIKDFAYVVPASVKPGAMVTVTNADSAPHTVTAKNEGGFDVEVPAGGTVVFKAPDAPGEYGIICSYHPQMTGTLVVK